jgi:phosphotransferase system  glucose/maltose/N-acetylglucosamine-specific IIC component
LLIGRPEAAGRGWRLVDRSGRIFMQKIVILLISGLIISFADFFDNFRFFTGILNSFLNQLKLFTSRLAFLAYLGPILSIFEAFCKPWGSFMSK